MFLVDIARDSFIDDLQEPMQSNSKTGSHYVQSTLPSHSYVECIAQGLDSMLDTLVNHTERQRCIVQGQQHDARLTQSLPFITCGMRLFCSLL